MHTIDRTYTHKSYGVYKHEYCRIYICTFILSVHIPCLMNRIEVHMYIYAPYIYIFDSHVPINMVRKEKKL